MKKSQLSQIVLLLILMFAQHSVAQNARSKACFIYNFAKSITWPSSEGDFIITILGTSEVLPELRSFTLNRVIGTQKILVNRALTLEEIEKCNILYIPEEKSSMISRLIQTSRSKNILIVTEKEDACSLGSEINLVNKGDKLTFEISRSNIQGCGLQVSNKLLQLGIATD